MSLVNDMLNDLEQRRGQQPAESRSQLKWLTGSSTTQKVRWPMLVIVGVIAVLVFLIAWLYKPTAGLEKAEAVLSEARTVSADSEVDSNLLNKAGQKPVLEKLSIGSIKTTSDIESVKLTLQLDRVPAYQLQQQPELLTIRLNDVQAQLPEQFGDVIAPLKAIGIRRQGNDLLVALSLTQAVNRKVTLSVDPVVELTLVLNAIQKIQDLAKPKSPQLDTQTERVADRQSSENPAEKKPAKTPEKALVNKAVEAQSVSTEAKLSSPVKKRLPLTLVQQDKRAVKEARNLLRLAEPLQAEQKLTQLLARYADAPESNQLLLALLLDQQRLDEAAQRLDYLASQRTLSLPFVELKARLLLQQGQAAEAVAVLRAQQPMIQVNTGYYELLALASQRDKQYSLSEQVYKALLNVDAGKGDWWAGLAIAQELQGQKADARQHYAQAVKANRTSDSLRQYARLRYQALAGMTNDDIKKTVEN